MVEVLGSFGNNLMVPSSATNIVLVHSGHFGFPRPAQNLSQEFLERLPIVRFPSRRQDLRLAFRKARMVKYGFGPGALLHQLKFHNRVDARSPAARSPSLHDSLVRHMLDVSLP